ncbi:MAG: hypothetical protein ACRDI2_12755 [Chloroflexota bacterium]
MEKAIREQLRHEPDQRTRNRFPMEPNDLATLELRLDPQRVYAERVYYDIDQEQNRVIG